MVHSNRQSHKIEETDTCPHPTIQTFIDDILSTIHQEPGLSMQETVVKTIDKIEDYMNSNKLALNRDKT